jgi:hypothetical protein
MRKTILSHRHKHVDDYYHHHYLAQRLHALKLPAVQIPRLVANTTFALHILLQRLLTLMLRNLLAIKIKKYKKTKKTDYTFFDQMCNHFCGQLNYLVL